jgi:hypothetical protein
MNSYMDWILASKDIVKRGEKAVCPNCGHLGLLAQFIGCTETRLGHAFIWCPSCLHGIHVSRTQIPHGVTVLPLTVSSGELRKYVPEITLISS